MFDDEHFELMQKSLMQDLTSNEQLNKEQLLSIWVDYDERSPKHSRIQIKTAKFVNDLLLCCELKELEQLSKANHPLGLGVTFKAGSNYTLVSQQLQSLHQYQLIITGKSRSHLIDSFVFFDRVCRQALWAEERLLVSKNA